MSRLSVSIAVVLLAGLVAPASAQDVYRWKDARGVTHYGDAPPAGVKATPVRTTPAPRAAGASTTAGATSTAAAGTTAAGENAQCTSARKNLALLQGSAPVGIDANGDGKPDSTMDAAQRATQAKLAQAGIEAYCTGAVPATPKA